MDFFFNIQNCKLCFSQKMKMLKEAIKVWNCSAFGRIEQRKSACLDIIAQLDIKEQTSTLSLAENFLREDQWKIYLG